MAHFVFAFLFTLLTAANAFVVPAPQTHQRPARSPIVWQSAFDDIRETVQEQVDNGAPLVEQAKQAGYLPGLHWGHGTVMAIVFFTMGITGAWLGWQIRLGNGDKVNSFTFGDTIREHHIKVSLRTESSTNLRIESKAMKAGSIFEKKDYKYKQKIGVVDANQFLLISYL